MRTRFKSRRTLCSELTPTIETRPTHQVNLGIEQVRANRARYRVVLQA